MREDITKHIFHDLIQPTREPRSQQGINPISSTLPMHRARCWLSDSNATTAVPTGTTVALPWDGHAFDSVGLHSDTVNNTRITIPTTGKISGLWLFHAHIYWLAGAGAKRRLQITENGLPFFGGVDNIILSSPTIDLTQDIWVFKDDPKPGHYFEIKANHDSAGTVNVAGLAQSYFEAIHLW